MLADRGVAPGKVLLGGFDLVPEVLQQMKAGYVQVQVDQQPYEQGFMPVMEVYLARPSAWRRPTSTPARASCAPDQVDAIMELSTQGVALSVARSRVPSSGAGARLSRRHPSCEDVATARSSRILKRLLKIYLEKPELAGVVLLVLLVIVFQIRSNGVFLGAENLRGMLGLLPEMGLVAIGVTILMICGEFDLSVGSVFALMPMTMAVLMVDGACPSPPRCSAASLVCAADRLHQRLS